MQSMQLPLPDRAYQLATRYELDEPIRVYQAKSSLSLKGLAGLTVFLWAVMAIIGFLSSGFRFDQFSLLFYGMLAGTVIVAVLFIFILDRLTTATAVYICEAGFIARNRRRIEVARWEEITGVLVNSSYTACTVQLKDKPPIRPNMKVEQFRFLAAELELKIQLGTHPEMALEIERQFEQLQHDPPWPRYAQEKASRYQEIASYLKQEDPEEAYKLGEDYQLGTVLSTHHATWQSIFLPNVETMGEFAFTVLLIIITIFSLLGGFSWKQLGTFGWILSGLWFTIPYLRTAWNTRLYFYEKGLIYIQPGSLNIILWEQIAKTVRYQPGTPLLGALCTLYLQNNDKLDINKRLNQREAIKQTLRERTPFLIVSPYEKRQSEQRHSS